MKTSITKVEIIPTQIPLIEPFVISVGALTHAQNTVIKIHTDAGIYGIGECSLNRSVVGETQKGLVEIGKIFGKEIIGKNPMHINDLTSLMSKLKTGNATIKSAFDMALHDVSAKLLGIPLYRFLNADNSNKKILTDMTISLLTKDEMVERAIKYVDQGFSILKIKLGERPSSIDVERIYCIRKEIGMDITLRLDANQGWNYLNASKALDILFDYDIQHCEEPLPKWNRRDQIRINRESPIPIMADESAFDHHETFQILADEAASLINIKIGKSGGIHNAMKIAGVAEAADIYCQVGSFSESRLGMTALTHYCYAWDNIIHYDMDAPLMLTEDPIVGGMTYNKDWTISVDEAPGLGADYDPSFLKHFEKITIQ